MASVRRTGRIPTLMSVLWLGLALLCGFAAGPAAAQLGREVTNIATVRYDSAGAPYLLTTNPATFIIEAQRTPSDIRFFRYAPGAPQILARIHGSDYSPSGDRGVVGQVPGGPGDPFQPVGAAVTLGGVTLDLSGPVGLAETAQFLAGELMFVRVSDPGQNGDPTVVETLVITIRSASGDEIVLRLYESGPDTGVFFAYVPSTGAATAPNDALLTALSGETLTATYADPFDTTEVSVDTALIDPFGRVFDSVTGALIDGVRVTVVDAATGQPAQVFGIDGVSPYPSTVETGGTVSDGAGLVYQLEPGQFLFPLMLPGTYRLLIDTPAGYVFPSTRLAADFAGLPNAPFTIQDGSYGRGFALTGPEAVSFDVPLDPAGELVVEKSVAGATASVGDTVGYTIEVRNQNPNTLPVRIRDVFPEGFRLADQSVRLDGVPVTTVVLSPDGRAMTVDAGLLGPGRSARLTYALKVSAGARTGPAINRAVAIDADGNPLSNASTASIDVIEDLLRSRVTLVGRVVEDGCDGDEPWARKIRNGKGVAGVRLYLETGAYVVTDEDGLYHFEGVTPGTHVVQVDTASLPAGYEPMACEENTRYAGSAISSFVDARGGTLWRADFYLKRTGAAAAATAEAEIDDATEYLNFDAAWLAAAAPGIRWAYPDTTRTPSSRSVNIGILHPKDFSVELSVNGRRVPAANAAQPLTADTTENALSRWRGVDIEAGENRFVARILGPDGEERAVLTESIWHITRIERARLVADQSMLAADGVTPPVIAVRLENAAGRPVHRGRSVKVSVSAPYMLLRDDAFEGDGVTDMRSTPDVTIGNDGVARIALEPTLQTGRVRVTVDLDDGRQEQFEVWLTPEKREWILVGLADGALGFADPAEQGLGHVSDMKDGRIAFFAKGMVRGDWLLTLAIDTAKRRGARDTALFDGHIDPTAYYTLYGDRTWQYSDAESRYPVYVKLEKAAVQFLFGDYNTDLGDQRLGRYDRRLSGLRAERQGRNVSAAGFVAETNQGFVKDELAADGTSGPYALSTAPIVRNSEVITLETRDRVRPDIVLSARPLARFIDYDLDYRTGALIFRHPVDVSDAAFNPNVIVIDYEAEADAERNATLGGRVSVHTEDRRLEAGVTYIREEGSPFRAGARGDLAAADAEARLSDTTRIRAEVATSSRDTGTGTERADAFLVEVERKSEALTVTGYYSEQQAGFGLGQQGSSTSGVRRIGTDGRVQLDESVSERTGRRSESYAEGRAYHEESLDTGAARDVAEVLFGQESEQTGFALGLKVIEETFGAGEPARDSVLATGLVRHTLPDAGITLTLSHEQPLGERNAASLFPQRTLAGLDKTLTAWATLNLRHEINNGADASGDNTLAGVTLRPWDGGEVRVAADQVTQDSAKRLSATVGVDQSFRLTDAWSVSLGAARRARIDGGDNPLDATPDAAVSPFEDGLRSTLVGEEGYTSAYAGAGYRADREAASVRAEFRDSELGRRWSGVIGAAREASDTLSYAAAARAETTGRSDGSDTKSLDARLGAAWRPRGDGMIVLTRLDARRETEDGASDIGKLVGNLAVNTRLSERAQAAISYGVKYQEADIEGARTSGVTQLLGLELRNDITPKVDFGVAMSALVDHETGTADYAFGPSVGFTPAENVWVSLGYNVAGFHDNDFDAAEYSQKGLYVKVRVKFDEHTASGLLKWMSPQASTPPE